MADAGDLAATVDDLGRQVDALKRIVRVLVSTLGVLNDELRRDVDLDTGRAAHHAQFDDDLRMLQAEIERVWGQV
jgi:hypothetical protein